MPLNLEGPLPGRGERARLVNSPQVEMAILRGRLRAASSALRYHLEGLDSNRLVGFANDVTQADWDRIVVDIVARMRETQLALGNALALLEP
jgi:hypothetical protein